MRSVGSPRMLRAIFVIPRSHPGRTSASAAKRAEQSENVRFKDRSVDGRTKICIDKNGGEWDTVDDHAEEWSTRTSVTTPKRSTRDGHPKLFLLRTDELHHAKHFE